ncbi:transmembrane protein 132A [Xyrichtys novacula]|nr:transmembrane protein 132A [Xyrichtys novacula]
MLPPHGQAPRPGLQASFGPYSVTQLIPEPILPSPLSASLLSEHVQRERGEGGQEVFWVRTLFHRRADGGARGTCITLHAFKETEEHKASCITQPPLGLCVVSLSLPGSWFKGQDARQSNEDLVKPHSNVPLRHRTHKREHRRHGHHHRNTDKHQHTMSPSLRYSPGIYGDTKVNAPRALRRQQGPMRDQIQLFYSSVDVEAEFEPTAAGCVEERAAQSQRKLVHIRALTLKEEKEGKLKRTPEKETCLNGQEEEAISLDSHVVIHHYRGPVMIGQPIRVSVNLRGNFSAEFVVIRLQVKKGLVSIVAQRTVTSDLWTVTLERSQGSTHDVVSILCHKQSGRTHTHTPSVLQQVVCLSVDGLRHSFGVAMTVSAHWFVEYSGRNNPASPHGAAVSTFSFTDRHIYGIAPITEGNTIINTAIFTNQPVSVPVIVLAISHDGKVSDVTSAVTCHSTNENTIKVSNDCSALFVDGSESGLGNTCAVVEFQLGMLSGSVCLEVWAPSVPLRVSLADPVLNAIDGWNHFTESGCGPVYQRSSVQVLTQFTAQDSEGRNTHLLGSSDWFVDVTKLVRDWLRVEDPSVASLSQNNLIGLRPGKTSIHVISEQWDGVLGRCDVTVTAEPVTPGDLSVQVVSGLGMLVTSSPAHPSIITTTVTAYNILYSHHQEASISVWLQFSDDSASLLSSFSDLPVSLLLSSLAESVVVVTPGPNQHIFAQGDGGGPLLRAELLVSTCGDLPITSNSISEADWIETRARRLARGSGWIRVNLDLGFLQPEEDRNEMGEEFEFDISDMLVESDIDVYATNSEEDDGGGNVSSDYDRLGGKVTDRKWNKAGNEGMISRNNLERAVLMPSQEEGIVYFSPSQEGGGRGRGEEEQGARELEVGVGAVLALICLSTMLFLANCLPCALKDKRRSKMEEEEEERGEGEGGGQEEEEQERKERATEEREEEGEKKKMKQVEGMEEVTEVEIIC